MAKWIKLGTRVFNLDSIVMFESMPAGGFRIQFAGQSHDFAAKDEAAMLEALAQSGAPMPDPTGKGEWSVNVKD